MTGPYETFTVRHEGLSVTVELWPDSDPPNPRREFDNLGTLSVSSRSRYGVSDKGAESFDYFRENFRKFRGAVLWLHMDGQGTTEAEMESANAVLYVHGSSLPKHYAEGMSYRSMIYRARKCLRGEFETYRAWAEGDVWGYVIKDENGDELPDCGASCWGFYGIKDARAESESYAKDYLRREATAQTDYAGRC
jgi:hypothetical protein